MYFTEEGELKRTLQSLACGKARVLLKSPKVFFSFFAKVFIINKDIFHFLAQKIHILSVQTSV